MASCPARLTISGWWLTPNTRGIRPPASRANSIMVMASPRGPPTPRVSQPIGRVPTGNGLVAGDQVEEAVVEHAQAARRRRAPRRSGGTRGAARAAGSSTFSSTPVLLPPFSGAAEHRVGQPRPVAHHAEGVADGEQRRVSRRRRCASKSRKSGACQEGSSRMPWLNSDDAVVLRRDRCGPGRRCRRRGRSARPEARGSCRRAARRRRARARGRRSPRRPAGARRRSSSRAWTRQSWPRFGQPWFMSSTATSTIRGSAGGRSSGRSTRTYSKAPQGASDGWSAPQNWELPGELVTAEKRHGSQSRGRVPVGIKTECNSDAHAPRRPRRLLDSDTVMW